MVKAVYQNEKIRIGEWSNSEIGHLLERNKYQIHDFEIIRLICSIDYSS